MEGLAIFGHHRERLTETAAQKYPLGSRFMLPDGRIFKYCKNGAVALSRGRLVQESVVIAGHGSDLVVQAAAAIGATAISLTNATTAITANEYAEGQLIVNDVDGEGQICTIKSHPAEATGTGTVVMTIEDEDALLVALTTSSEVGLRYNPYKNVLVAPITVTGIVVGCTPLAVTADYYFWAQTWGQAAVLTNGTLIRGLNVVRSGTTAGAVDVNPLNSVDASGQEQIIGNCRAVMATTEYSLIFLTIAP